VYGTHHIGASTEQAQNAIADEVVRIVAGFAVGEVRHAVNEETALLGSTTLEVRHRNEVGVLAAVLGLLGEAGLNVEQMVNRIFAGDRAASAVIRITGDVSPVVLTAVASHDAVFGVALTTNEERA
jgi:D-3-phosphoglycerate dehydrogenase